MRKSYKILFKLNVVNFAEKNNITRASERYKISRKVIRDWKKNKNQLIEMSKKKHRAYLRYKKIAFFPEMESELFDHLMAQRANGVCITGPYIIDKAREIGKKSRIDRFEGKITFFVRKKKLYKHYFKLINLTKIFLASQGWLRNFLFRHNLCLRRVTTIGRELPEHAYNWAMRFIQTAKNITRGKNRSHIYAMDETSIPIDSPFNYTYEKRGRSRIKATTAGGEKAKINIIFAAAADGTKLPPIVLIPRKLPLKVRFLLENNMLDPNYIISNYYHCKRIYHDISHNNLLRTKTVLLHNKIEKLIK